MRTLAPEAAARTTRRRRAGPSTRSGLLRDAVRLCLATLVGGLLVAAYATYRVWEQGARDDARRAGAIVVLGAAQFDGRPSDVFAARLDHAVALYLAGYAPYLVVTGGKQPGDRTTEAAAAAAYAERRGVPASAILAEDHGRTTLESIEAVGAILRQHGIDDAIFVSDRTHMLRVLRMAGDRGIIALGSPTPTSPTDLDPGRRAEATLHELGALGLYFFVEEPLGRGVTALAGLGLGLAPPVGS
ncbi:MAG TPA: YdcF family protein [Candidatus Limnocylindrales bacterium]